MTANEKCFYAHFEKNHCNKTFVCDLRDTVKFCSCHFDEITKTYTYDTESDTFSTVTCHENALKAEMLNLATFERFKEEGEYDTVFEDENGKSIIIPITENSDLEYVYLKKLKKFLTIWNYY